MVWYGGEGGGLVKTSNIAQSGLQGDCGLHGVSIEQRGSGRGNGLLPRKKSSDLYRPQGHDIIPNPANTTISGFKPVR